MSDIWYYVDQRGRVGPLTLPEMRATLATMPNPRDALVWCRKFPNWKRAIDVPELWVMKVASPSNAGRPLPEMRPEKRQSARKSRWGLITTAVEFLGSAGNSAVRELMGQLSSERQITKEGAWWIPEGRPRDSIVSALNALKADRLAVLTVVVCVAYGVYDGLVRNSIFSGLVVGILSAAFLNLLIWTARKYRVRKPSQLLIGIGNTVFLFGLILGLYSVFLIIYETSLLGVVVGIKAAMRLLPSAIFYPALGWGVRYLLGAGNDRGHRRSAGERS